MADECFWTAALYTPLRETLARWQALHTPRRRFVQAVALADVLVDGTSRDVHTPAPRTMRCVGVPAHAWLAERLVLAYVLQAPYRSVAHDTPEAMQPFRPPLEQLVAFLADKERVRGVWCGIHADAAVRQVHDALRVLLGAADHLPELGACVPAEVGRLPQCPHHTVPLARVEVETAVSLLQRAAQTPLAIADQRALAEKLSTESAMDACLAVQDRTDTLGVQDVAQVVAHNPAMACQWVVASATHYPFPAPLMDALGEVLALYADTSVSIQRRAHHFLGRLLLVTAPSPVFQWRVQAQCVPRYLGVRLQHLPTHTEPDAYLEEWAGFVAQLVEKGLLPLHVADRTCAPDGVPAADDRLAHDTLDALAIELRSWALAHSQYTFGARLFAALTSPVVRA